MPTYISPDRLLEAKFSFVRLVNLIILGSKDPVISLVKTGL